MDGNKGISSGNRMDCRFVGATCAMQSHTTDHHYQQHPKGARVTSQTILAALKFGGHDYPRYVIGFECSEYGVSRYDEHDKKGALITSGLFGTE